MPTLAINQIISIPPEEMNLVTLENNPVSIPIPTSHIGKKPIHVRLMSAKRRIGMVCVVFLFPKTFIKSNLKFSNKILSFSLNLTKFFFPKVEFFFF